MQRRLSQFLILFLLLTPSSSGAKTARQPANSKAIRLQGPAQLTLRRLQPSSLSTVADQVVPCHLQVSGTGGSYSTEKHNLMRGQDRALADSPLPSSKPALEVPA